MTRVESTSTIALVFRRIGIQLAAWTVVVGCSGEGAMSLPSAEEIAVPLRGTYRASDELAIAVVDRDAAPVRNAKLLVRHTRGTSIHLTDASGWADLSSVPSDVESFDVHVGVADFSLRSWLGLAPGTYVLALDGRRLTAAEGGARQGVRRVIGLPALEREATVVVVYGTGSWAARVAPGASELVFERSVAADSGDDAFVLLLDGDPLGADDTFDAVDPLLVDIRWADVLATARGDGPLEPRPVAPLDLDGDLGPAWMDSTWERELITELAPRWRLRQPVDAGERVASPQFDLVRTRFVARSDGRWAEAIVHRVEDRIEVPALLEPRTGAVRGEGAAVKLAPRADDVRLTHVTLRMNAASGSGFSEVLVLDGRDTIDLEALFDLADGPRPLLEPPWEAVVDDCRLESLGDAACAARAIRRDVFD